MTDVLADATERARIADEVIRVAGELRVVDAERTRLFAERLDLWLAGRALDPPITQRELAALAGVTEPAVIQALKKARTQETTPHGQPEPTTTT